MAPVSTWPTRTGCSACSSVCTPPASTPERASASRPFSASSIAPAAAPGPRGSRTRAQSSTSLYPTMMVRRSVEPPARPGFAAAVAEENSQLRAPGVSGHISSMKGPLQVLIVEDSENDAALLELELQQAGYETICQRVDTPGGLRSALAAQSWDVIIADYVMPQFSGLTALAIVAEAGLDIPFIIVSGHITEDTAVAAMKAGAHDYVMKDKPQRLAPAVQRELREAEVRRLRRRSEETLKIEHAITRVLAGADSLEDAIQQIVHLLIEGLDVDVGTFWVVDGKQLLPFTVITRGASASIQAFAEETRRLNFGQDQSLPGRVWRSRRAEWLADFSKLP